LTRTLARHAGVPRAEPRRDVILIYVSLSIGWRKSGPTIVRWPRGRSATRPLCASSSSIPANLARYHHFCPSLSRRLVCTRARPSPNGSNGSKASPPSAAKRRHRHLSRAAILRPYLPNAPARRQRPLIAECEVTGQVDTVDSRSKYPLARAFPKPVAIDICRPSGLTGCNCEPGGFLCKIGHKIECQMGDERAQFSG